jgi:cephalosporin hydroxylase
MLKFAQDLDRYEQIIEATKPEVIVETGTHTGASARWFADHGVDVITVDVNRPTLEQVGQDSSVVYITGSSTDPAVVAHVAELVAGRRCMVTLDSDHSGPHVTAEIDAYGPMVTPGCYLVVEDGIFGYGEDAKVRQGLAGLDGSPMDAIMARLVDNEDWSRDVAIERLHAISHNPGGWWIRNG